MKETLYTINKLISSEPLIKHRRYSVTAWTENWFSNIENYIYYLLTRGQGVWLGNWYYYYQQSLHGTNHFESYQKCISQSLLQFNFLISGKFSFYAVVDVSTTSTFPGSLKFYKFVIEEDKNDLNPHFTVVITDLLQCYITYDDDGWTQNWKVETFVLVVSCMTDRTNPSRQLSSPPEREREREREDPTLSSILI